MSLELRKKIVFGTNSRFVSHFGSLWFPFLSENQKKEINFGECDCSNNKLREIMVKQLRRISSDFVGKPKISSENRKFRRISSDFFFARFLAFFGHFLKFSKRVWVLCLFFFRFFCLETWKYMKQLKFANESERSQNFNLQK